MIFTRHTLRPIQPLAGLWEFEFLGDTGAGTFQPTNFEAVGLMPVPSAFDALPAHAGKRGLAAYRTKFNVPAGRRALLDFGAVSMWSRIFLDGKAVAENACGYAPFRVGVPASETVARELVVLVDNRFDFERVPMHEGYFDFYQYGGILRDVYLHILPASGPWIEQLKVTPAEDYQSGEIAVELILSGEISQSVLIETTINEEQPVRQTTALSGHTISFLLRVGNPRLWSPDSPHLHNLQVNLLDEGAAPIDDAVARFGLRKVESRDGALWLNGEKLILKGVNRHEWHPNFGPCTPTLQMAADLQLLKGLACNFVRGAHYHQDQRFLDLCDEMGFLVWEENLGWGQREKAFASEKFRRDHLQALEAMLKASHNHPSIIIWGFLNEAGTDQDYVRPVFEETAAFLRRSDPSRLISYATMFALDDRHYDLVDLISLNLYPGWYHSESAPQPLDLIKPAIDSVIAEIDLKGWNEKPVLISEIGAEALYGWRDPHDDFFTEEYQAQYLRRACETALGNPRCCGIAIWHFSDVRTYSGGRSLLRPRTFNNKGLFDEYRRPKTACQTVKTAFSPAGA